MNDTTGIRARVDLKRIHDNVEKIVREANVGVMAVVKADAYGMGAYQVARALVDLVEGYCVFALEEAASAKLSETGKPTLVLGPPGAHNAAEHLEQRARPAVTTEAEADALKSAWPAVCVDTGMQRFSCPIDNLDHVIRAGDCREAFTHATSISQAEQFASLPMLRGMKLHASGSSLLHEPAALLNAVRPGIALFEEAIQISSRLIETRDTRGPAGYTGFSVRRHGVIFGGYGDGLRIGPCRVNGRLTRILEVGMQTSFVEIDSHDAVGDDVILLGDGLTPREIARSWQSSPHEVLVRLSSGAQRSYVE